jgi:hypothetical protein
VKGNGRYRKNENARAQSCRSKRDVKKTEKEYMEWEKRANVKGKEAENQLE